MSNQRTVYGVTAELADEFSPQQWVNLYQLDPGLEEAELHFWRKCQIRDIPAILAGSFCTGDHAFLSNFALEPLDEQGNVISVQQALDKSDDN